MILRLRFSKLGRIRWTSQRDVARIWERTLRRGRVPVSYTNGFSPRPKLSFGLALPTACESVAEYLDVTLDSFKDAEDVSDVLQPLLPGGIEITGCSALGAGLGSLQEEVTSCTWEIGVPGLSPAELSETVSRVMVRSSLVMERERKGRTTTDDVRPSIVSMEVVGEPRPISQPHHQHHKVDGICETEALLVAELATRPRGVRPAELASAMGENFGLIRRTHQWIERDGSKFEPLDLRTAVCAGAEASVS